MLGRAADVWGYAGSYLLGAGISLIGVPFLLLSRRQNAAADTIEGAATVAAGPTDEGFVDPA